MPAMLRASLLTVGLVLSHLIPSLAVAQVPAPLSAPGLPLLVPKGRIQWTLSAEFENWDWRWNNGGREEAVADFNAPLDRRFLPTLGASEDALRRATGIEALNLSVGRAVASQIVGRNTFGIGGALGLTRWLTVRGWVPIVAVDAEPRVVIDSSGANAAFNPASPVYGDAAGRAATQSFFIELNSALAVLNGRIAAGDYDSDPALKQRAIETAARVQAKQADLTALLQSPTADFAPTRTSAAGVALLQLVATLRSDLAAVGVTGATGQPALPGSRLGYAGFEEYLTNPDGSIRTGRIDTPVYSYLGDVEVGASIGLIDRYPASTFGSGIRTVLDGTVRLRTAQLDQPDRLFDVGTGDRQPDVEISLVTDLSLGRLGARLTGGYNLQLPGNQNRRVTPREQPIAPATSLAGVRRDPGDVVRLSAQPFFRLAPYLMFYAGVDYWSRGVDQYSYVAGQPEVEGVDLAVLADGSKSTFMTVNAGLTYTHSGVDKLGRRKLPMDASFRYQRIVRSQTGILPDAHLVRIDLRFYTRLFGEQNGAPAR